LLLVAGSYVRSCTMSGAHCFVLLQRAGSYVRPCTMCRAHCFVLLLMAGSCQLCKAMYHVWSTLFCIATDGRQLCMVMYHFWSTLFCSSWMLLKGMSKLDISRELFNPHTLLLRESFLGQILDDRFSNFQVNVMIGMAIQMQY